MYRWAGYSAPIGTFIRTGTGSGRPTGLISPTGHTRAARPGHLDLGGCPGHSGCRSLPTSPASTPRTGRRGDGSFRCKPYLVLSHRDHEKHAQPGLALGYAAAWPRRGTELVAGLRLPPGFGLAPGFGLTVGLGLGLTVGLGLGLTVGLGLALGLGLTLAPGLGLAAGLGQAARLGLGPERGLASRPRQAPHLAARLGAVCR